jgi:hypothetical protein
MLEANWTVDLSEELEDDEPDEIEELRFKMGRGSDAIRTVKDEGEVITSPTEPCSYVHIFRVWVEGYP